MAREQVSPAEDQGVFESIQQMPTNGVRRMPVVDGEGGLVGIISVDDLIQLLSEEMSACQTDLARTGLRGAEQTLGSQIIPQPRKPAPSLAS